MYAFIVSNLNDEVSSVTVYNDLDEAVSAYEDYTPLSGDDCCLLKISSGKSFGINDTGSFGGEELLSNL
jgi:hypothetical protein